MTECKNLECRDGWCAPHPLDDMSDNLPLFPTSMGTARPMTPAIIIFFMFGALLLALWLAYKR